MYAWKMLLAGGRSAAMPMAHDSPLGKLRFILVEREGVQDGDLTGREDAIEKSYISIYAICLRKERRFVYASQGIGSHSTQSITAERS